LHETVEDALTSPRKQHHIEEMIMQDSYIPVVVQESPHDIPEQFNESFWLYV
jgi:hypothetical protein